MQKDKENRILSAIGVVIAAVLGVVLIIFTIMQMSREYTDTTPSLSTVSLTVIVFFACLVLVLKFQKIDKNLDILNNSVASLTNSVNKIIDWINKTDKNSPLSVNSPLALNEKGGGMASDMAADDIIDAHKNSLITKLDALNIKNPYDVQVACLSMKNETWEEILMPETLDKIKKLAFTKGIELDHYYTVLGLKLRDLILGMRNE